MLRLMKKVLSALIGAAFMASCSSSSYVQVVDMKGSVPVENSNFTYSDNACKITYNLWSNGGDAGFRVENLTDQVIYINLANSFFIENGTAHDYFRNRTYGKGSAVTNGKSAAKSASAYGIWVLTNLLGTASVSVSESEASSSSSNVTTEEKEIVAIPPHASKRFSEYSIAGDVIQDCAVKLFPKKKAPQSVTFTEGNSPIRFTKYITYKVGEEGESKVVTQDFYVSGFTNYNYKDVVGKEKAGCKSQVTIDYNKYAHATKYYITYGKAHNNSNSADCKEEVSWSK